MKRVSESTSNHVTICKFRREKSPPGRITVDEQIVRLNEQMDMVLENQKQIIETLRKLTNSGSKADESRESLIEEEELQKFPLTEIEQLDIVEEALNDPDNRYFQTMKDIIKPENKPRPGGLRKHFHLLMKADFFVQFNYDGIHNKYPFKKYKNFNNAIYRIQKVDGYTEDDYVTEIRAVFRAYKNRKSKNNSNARKKLKEAQAHFEPEIDFEKILWPDE
ncbi:uncharacterized protein LOC113566206 [Drosophila persimilis]|uniref:uncharacterized protein LOC113566206 n=1 Tax=Drosophila persimilis TaxID=7234 RepID=UPI000F07B589|nr:uncharacterized protein LOC113566206 [Drosophila persimilis]